MKLFSASMLLVVLLSSVTYAQPLKPMTKGSFDGIPIEQAMSTLHVLGKWILPQHGTIQVFTLAGGPQKGCIGAETDPDYCASGRLYVAAEDSLIETRGLTTQFYPETYFLLRGAGGTGWYLPENGTLKFITADSYSLDVCGSEFTTKLSGGAIIPAAYTLRVVRREEKDKRYFFSATMEKHDSGSRFGQRGCGFDQMFARDENFKTNPPSIKPGKAPR
jgi:hypothetical protein